MKITKKLLNVLPPMAFLLMTFCIFMPSSLFLGNIDEFAVEYIQVLPIIAVVSLAVAAVILLVGVIMPNEKVLNVYSTIVFSVALGFYLQGNFFNPKLSVLNGTEIDWSNYTTSGVLSVAMWLVCLIAPQVVMHFKKDIVAMVAKWGSWFFTAVQLSTLMVLILTTTKTVDTDFALTKKGQFELSKNDNIVMFVVDTLDATWFERDVQNSEYANDLKDFTYFDNAVAGGAPTVLGMPTIFTGYNYNGEGTLDEYYVKAYEQSNFFKDLESNNYDIKLYTEYSYLNGADKNFVYNAEHNQRYVISSPVDFGSYLYKLVAFYSMPQPLKQPFWFYSDIFSRYVSVEKQDLEVYALDDPQLYKDFKNSGLKADSSNNTFAVYHLFGAHGPYSMDENAQAVEESKTSQTQQIYGSFKIITEYIEEMRKIGVYDDSTIIITADHGGVDLYQNPAIFIKQKGATQDKLAVNSDPVTFKNLHATLASTALKDASSYGPTMFDMAGNTDVRYHTSPHVLNKERFPEDEYVLSKDYCLFKIIGNPRDMNNITPVKDENEIKNINTK